MFIRTSITLALCAALVACGGKNKSSEDGDADATPDADDVTEVTDPADDPVEDPVDDPVDDPTEDPTVDPEEDTTVDPEEDATVDPEEDAAVDPEDDAEMDAVVDAGDDAEMDVPADESTDTSGETSDAGTDAHTVMLFFSEYVEGSSNNKAVEIYNAGTSSFDLSTCTVSIYFNGSTTATATITLSSSMLAADDVHVLCHTSFSSTGTSPCDQTAGNLSFNGDDAVELACGSTTYDVIGQIGVDPGAFWGTGSVTTQDHTLRRKCTITAGDADGSDAFDPVTEWDGFAVDTFTGLGEHCP